MRRRTFFQQVGMAAVASRLSPNFDMAEKMFDDQSRVIKPARLREGSRVALIAPASSFSEEKLANARTNFTNLGFTLVEGKNLYAQNGYLAGTDTQRLADLHEAFANPEIDAIWCIRGGYGCTRLLPHIDFDLIKRNPKPFIGYSDITALHLAIHDKTGLVTFHGPVAAANFPDATLRHFRAALMEPLSEHAITTPDQTAELPGDEFVPFLIAPGAAEGVLTGGNLSLLAALAGTPWMPSFRDRIVCIEDVGEQPYRIDRMLTQLLQATDLSRAAGIALGVFSGCKPKGDGPSQSLEETLNDKLGGLGIPVIYDIPFGHVDLQATLPFGINAALDTEKGSLTLLEKAVKE